MGRWTYTPPMGRGERIALRTGTVLCGVGLMLVSFVAYQLWGTALYESRAQGHLRSELTTQLHHRLPTSPAGLNGAQHHSGLPPLASTPAPLEPTPAVTAPIGLISIPAINVSFAIVQGVTETQLEQGPGHYPGTPLPGEPGNVAIAGHRTTYAHPFYNLNELQPGDAVYILTTQGLFRYTVTGTQVVPPTDVGVLDTVASASTLTLTTCNPRYSAATRMVVTADFTPGPGPRQTRAPTSRAIRRRLALRAIPGDALTGTSQSFWPGILWGLATLAVAVAIWLLWRRSPRRLRWLTVVVAVPLVAGGLLMCFEHISLALPGSF